MGNTSPLRKAMLTNDLEAVQTILEAAGEGAPDLINEDFTSDCLYSSASNTQSPLHTAASRDKANIVELLLQYGGDINAPGLWGQTSIHLAAKQNSLDLCKMAVKYGADIYTEDADGRRPVHSAAMSFVGSRNGSYDTLKYLLGDVGKLEDVDLKDGYGNTPLHLAAKYGNEGAVKYLAAMGAKIDEKNNRGRTPLQEANVNHKENTVALLENMSQKPAKMSGEEPEDNKC